MRFQRQFAWAAGALLCTLAPVAARVRAQNLPPVEKQAADAVANLVQQIRSQNQLPKLERMDDALLHDQACARTKDGDTSSKMGSEVTVQHGAVALSHLSYSTNDPVSTSPVLESWTKEKDSRDPRRFAAGACFITNQENPNGKYWIEVSTYMSPAKSFFYRAGSGLARLWSR